MKPALVIFDCDGVLVDSEPITNAAMARDLTAHGLSISTEQCMELFVGGTIRMVFEQATEMGANLPDDWIPCFYEQMFMELADKVEAIPGIHTAVTAIQQAGIATCVASNGPMRKMEVTLGRTELWDHFEGRIFSAHEVGTAKPEPGLFLHAAAAFGARPEACVVIEDSASGARAAEAAAMRCFGYTKDTPAEKLTRHGARAFDDTTELPRLLELDG